MTALLEGLRQGARTLLRRPLFVLLVWTTLAVGIGASTAIFSVADAVLFKPLPYKDSERLVFLWNRLGKTGVDKTPVSGPDFADFVDETKAFDEIVGFYTINTAITEDAVRVEPINMSWASPGFFSLFGARLALGQMYGPEDEGRADPSTAAIPGAEIAPTPVILSYELWQRRYNGDPGVLGRTVQVNGQSMVIQGVAPQGFHLFLGADSPIPERIDAWTPFPYAMRSGSRDLQWINVLARLRPGVTLPEAQGEMDGIAAMQREQFEFHKSSGTEILVVPMHEEVTGHVRSQLLWLLGVGTGLLLLLSFANVTGLLLLRSWERRREVSVRAALGGRPKRLALQVLGETLLLTLVGGALGVLVAQGGIRLLLALKPQNLPRVDQAGLDGAALAVAFAASVAAALICALVPAWQASRLDLASILSERSATADATHQRLRKALVVLAIAVALVLLAGSGLVLRSASELRRVDVGFDPENVLTAKIVLPFFKYPSTQQRSDFYDELLRLAAEIPGVESAGAIHPLPFATGRQSWFGPWSAEGLSHDEWMKREADYRQTAPGFFETLGVTLLKGRFLTEADNRADAPPVVVVDHVMAQRAWPDVEDPVGRRLMIWNFDDTGMTMIQVWADVVGVVRHLRDDDLKQDGKGTVYAPLRFYAFPELSLTLKSASGDPLDLAQPLRQAVESIDPDQSMIDVRPMQAYLDDAFAPTRFALVLISAFAVVATVLAAVGLYGVIASVIQQRSHEIGVRMAFGARRLEIVRMVLVQALVLAAWGVGLGLAGALLLNRGLQTLLYGVTPSDPATLTTIVLVQAAVALLAAMVPAWRATRVDPATTLRGE